MVMLDGLLSQNAEADAMLVLEVITIVVLIKKKFRWAHIDLYSIT